jgi:6-phosphogluconate dehydrogenase
MVQTQIGLVGLGPMGLGLAKNLAEKGFEVFAWDEESQINANVSNTKNRKITVCQTLRSLVSSLKPSRTILLCIPSGSPVTDVLTQLTELLSKNDVVADCGNSHFHDTRCRENHSRKFDIEFLGVGVSGGPDGARNGPSIMAGGSRSGWSSVQQCFEAISAKVGGKPCCAFLGQGGSGHYVKMVHNGIEYGVMHLLLEIYAILCRTSGNNNERIAEVFNRLNSGQTASYLMNVTARVLAERRSHQGSFLVDEVDSRAEQKGTGIWTVQTALDLGIPVPTISEAVMFRQLSATLEQSGVSHAVNASLPEWFSENTTKLQDAVLLAILSTFAQGISLLTAGKEAVGNELDVRAVLQTWRGGCVLEGAVINLLTKASNKLGDGNDVLTSPALNWAVSKGIQPLRSLIMDAIFAGIPCSGLASSLAYVESKRGYQLPTSLTQLQRNYFGQHPIYNKWTGEPIKVLWRR